MKKVAQLVILTISLIILFGKFSLVWGGPQMYQRCQTSTDCVIGEYVFDSDGSPVTSQICTIDVRDPDGTLIVDDGVVSANSDGWHSYTTNLSSSEGLYRALMYCNNSGDTGYIDKSFILGTTFENLDESVWSSASRTLSSFGSFAGDVWNSLTSTLTTTSSVGKLMVDNINASISSRSTHQASDVWSKLTIDLTSGGSVGELLSTQIGSIKTLGLVNQQLLEKIANSPEIKVWYEKGSIILKAEITNPSTSLTQTVEFKQLLPKEVKPEHIVQLDGLNVEYDSIENAYYLFGDFELTPQETIVKSVKIKNVWQIADSEIEELRKGSTNAAEFLQGSSYYTQGSMLANEINSSLGSIKEKQDEAITPEEYIIVYRENLANLEVAKRNFQTLEGFVLAWEGEKKVVANVGGVQITSTWGIILAVVFGIGVLGAVNFRLLARSKIRNLSNTDSSEGIGKTRTTSETKSRKMPKVLLIATLLIGALLVSYPLSTLLLKYLGKI